MLHRLTGCDDKGTPWKSRWKVVDMEGKWRHYIRSSITNEGVCNNKLDAMEFVLGFSSKVVGSIRRMFWACGSAGEGGTTPHPSVLEIDMEDTFSSRCLVQYHVLLRWTGETKLLGHCIPFLRRREGRSLVCFKYILRCPGEGFLLNRSLHCLEISGVNLIHTDCGGETKDMDPRHRQSCCFDEIGRLSRDLDWNFRALRHVNRKYEHLRNQWDNWSSREEEAKMQEWHAQSHINNTLRVELAELKEHSLVHEQQISQLRLMADHILHKSQDPTAQALVRPDSVEDSL